MTNGRELWPSLEKGLTELLETLKPNLDGDTFEIVKDFIDNREFRVALEWLYSYLIENNVQLSSQQLQTVRGLAKLMEIDLHGQRNPS